MKIILTIKENWKWMAKDKNGYWFVYKEKPEIINDKYWANYGQAVDINKDLLNGLPKRDDWRESLIKIN